MINKNLGMYTLNYRNLVLNWMNGAFWCLLLYKMHFRFLKCILYYTLLTLFSGATHRHLSIFFTLTDRYLIAFHNVYYLKKNKIKKRGWDANKHLATDLAAPSYFFLNALLPQYWDNLYFHFPFSDYMLLMFLPAVVADRDLCQIKGNTSLIIPYWFFQIYAAHICPLDVLSETHLTAPCRLPPACTPVVHLSISSCNVGSFPNPDSK